MNIMNYGQIFNFQLSIFNKFLIFNFKNINILNFENFIIVLQRRIPAYRQAGFSEGKID